MNTTYMLAVIGTLFLGTFLTRVTPFLLFPAGKTTPKYVVYLGKVLPSATIGMLVVYCLKGVAPSLYPYGLPEFIAVSAVVLLQWFKKNTLLSIGLGTILYMVLIQVVFK